MALRGYLDTTRYVLVNQVKLDESVKVNDLEIDSVQDVELIIVNGVIYFYAKS